jgi:hypothetical protein
VFAEAYAKSAESRSMRVIPGQARCLAHPARTGYFILPLLAQAAEATLMDNDA